MSSRGTAPRGRRARRGALCALLAAVVALGCGPIVIELEGRRVFNPDYRFLLRSPERDLWQKPAEILEASGIGPGSVIADIGAGTGYLTLAASDLVGPEGRVFATDVQPEMIAELERLAEEVDHANVRVVRGSFERPELPEGCCEVAFFLNVYKEIDPRVPFLRETMRSLGEGGRVVIVGFEPESPGPGPPREMRLSAEQVIAECESAGLRLTASHDFLPLQYMLVFEPATAADPVAPPERRTTVAVEPEARSRESQPN